MTLPQWLVIVGGVFAFFGVVFVVFLVALGVGTIRGDRAAARTRLAAPAPRWPVRVVDSAREDSL
ncbi:hypothetical protein [Sphaerisporangium aureirubrum]|uniref:Uncharacterized protein n=1 Tax=Sphaerisporangium aureirubrum TaxID=1544736 RepID=A0ABW1NCN6_9ACTN